MRPFPKQTQRWTFGDYAIALIRSQPDPRAPRPNGNGWELQTCFVADGDVINRWANGTIMACSSRHAGVESKKSGLIVPSFHLSISSGGHRASDDVIRGVLADFDLEGAEEDNHQPGIARHFWLDEGNTVQPECECKSIEETVIESDGYRWQRERR